MSSERALLYCAGGGIGDSLVASIVAQALATKYREVDALTLPGHREALEHIPDFAKVLVDGDLPERELAGRLAARDYEAAIVTWATPHTARTVYQSKIPIRVGQANRLYSWRFTHRVPVRSENGDVTSHWSQILLDYARAVGCDVSDPAVHFVPSASDERDAEALCNSLGLTRGNFAIVHPANAVASRRGIWPLAGWGELVRRIAADFNMPVLITGNEDDTDIAEGVAALAGGISIAGRTTIGSFGALTQRAAFFAGITTGAMHVAAACGCPTIGIFPFQTDTPDRWAPLGPATAIVRASYPCPPGERKETCPDYACIAHLDVPRVVQTIESLLRVPAK